MNEVLLKLRRCYGSIREKTNFTPLIALVLGSGLGDYADGDDVSIVNVVEYKDIDEFPVSTVSGHKGRFVFAKVHDVPVVIMQGRVHYYEGYPMSDVVLPVRLAGLLGAKALVLTNASGGLNPDFHAGDFMLIEDQIASFVPCPLIGQNLDEIGPRFPDMSEIYNCTCRDCIQKAADELNIPLQHGVYIQLTGPNYESPAEVRMCRSFGGDAVGMSTACEAIAANHMGMKVCGISCITNMASGISKVPLNHKEVQETADRVALLFKNLVTNSLINIAAIL